jgi:hypothetical protein
MVNRILLIAVLMSGSYIFAQQSDCKVNLPDISGSYTGGCKNGLAHGKGVAQGIDHYEGQFVRGMPDGKGTYRWANGNYYEGQWKDGLKDGSGKMVYGDSIVSGYWRENKYMGAKLVPPYKILSSISVARSTITKSINSGNGVRIRLLLGGSDNSTVENFSLAYDSGDEYRLGSSYGIQNATFPMYVKVTYRTWNQLHTIQYDVIFEFTLNEPGTWEVVLNN